MADFTWDVDIDGVRAEGWTVSEARVQYGRETDFDQPSPGNCTLTMLASPSMGTDYLAVLAWFRRASVGSRLRLRNRQYGLTVFSGEIAEMDMRPDAGSWVLTLSAYAALQRFSRATVPNEITLPIQSDDVRIRQALLWAWDVASDVPQEASAQMRVLEKEDGDSAYELARTTASDAGGILYDYPSWFDLTGRGTVHYQPPIVRTGGDVIERPGWNDIHNPKPVNASFFVWSSTSVGTGSFQYVADASSPVGPGYLRVTNHSPLRTLYLSPSNSGDPAAAWRAVQPGENFILSCYVRTYQPEGNLSFITLNLTFYDEDRAEIVGSGSTLPGTQPGIWARRYVQVAAPLDAHWVRVQVMNIAIGTGAENYDLSGLMLERGSLRISPANYWDGDSGAGYSWDGAANASASRYTPVASTEDGITVLSGDGAHFREDDHEWRMAAWDLRNSVRVYYGPDAPGPSDGRAHADASSAPSIEAYGTWYASIDSDLETEVDARTLANRIVEQDGLPRWRMASLTRMNEVAQNGEWLRASLGYAVLMQAPTLPLSPVPDWIGWVEGWEHQIGRDTWETRYNVGYYPAGRFIAEVEVFGEQSGPLTVAGWMRWRGGLAPIGLLTLEVFDAGQWVQIGNVQRAPEASWEPGRGGTMRVRWIRSVMGWLQGEPPVYSPMFTVDIAADEPHADIRIQPTNGQIPLDVQWDATNSTDDLGRELTYLVTLPDGTTSTEPVGTYSFPAEPEFDPTPRTFHVLVENTDGFTDEDTATFSPTEAPPVECLPEADYDWSADGLTPISDLMWMDFQGQTDQYAPIIEDTTDDRITLEMVQGEGLRITLTATDRGAPYGMILGSEGLFGVAATIRIHPHCQVLHPHPLSAGAIIPPLAHRVERHRDPSRALAASTGNPPLLPPADVLSSFAWHSLDGPPNTNPYSEGFAVQPGPPTDEGGEHLETFHYGAEELAAVDTRENGEWRLNFIIYGLSEWYCSEPWVFTWRRNFTAFVQEPPPSTLPGRPL